MNDASVNTPANATDTSNDECMLATAATAAATDSMQLVLEFPSHSSTSSDDVKYVSFHVQPSDVIADVKVFIGDLRETRYFTAFSLAVPVETDDGSRLLRILQPNTKIGEVKALISSPPSPLVLVNDKYTVRDVRIHVKRMRALCGNIPAASIAFGMDGLSPSSLSKVLSSRRSDFDSNNHIEDPSYLFPHCVTTSNCISHIGYSTWNPPLPSRMLAGDLLYLEVQSVENPLLTIHITASISGFFINGTTSVEAITSTVSKGKKNGKSNKSFQKFNPRPHSSHPHVSSTLAELLSHVSPKVLEHFFNPSTESSEEVEPKGCNLRMIRALETVPAAYQLKPWAVVVPSHCKSAMRAEESLLTTCVDDAPGQQRDWNEEWQNARMLPATSLADRVNRDRNSHKINADFSLMALEGVKAIVDGEIPAMNPLDTFECRMYLWRNIFFSYSSDSRGVYTSLGGDSAAWTAASYELHGVRSYNNLPFSGIHTPATCLVDYRGRRMVCQSIIPGIVQPGRDLSIRYGSTDTSVDHSVDICSNESLVVDTEFMAIMDASSSALGLAKHTINDVELTASLVTKGLVGTDGRNYLMDLYRTTPIDANYEGKGLALLRPELLASYRKFKGAHVSYNPDVSVRRPLVDDSGDINTDLEVTYDMAKYLRSEAIPYLLNTLTSVSASTSIFDGVSLTSLMHEVGVNIRYLGELLDLVSNSDNHNISYIIRIGTTEIIARCLKRVVRSLFKNLGIMDMALAVAHILTCLLGGEGYKKSKNYKRKLQSISYIDENDHIVVDSIEAILSLTCKDIRLLISHEAHDHFSYTLPESWTDLIGNTTSFLRSISIQLRIQIVARCYNSRAVEEKDILDIYPRVKHMSPRNSDIGDLIEKSCEFLMEGIVSDAASLLSNALMLSESIFGHLNSFALVCHQELATLFYRIGNLNAATERQLMAITLSERLSGIDSSDTLVNYIFLSSILKANEQFSQALACLHHCRRIAFTLHGTSVHPHVASIEAQIGHLLLKANDTKRAISCFECAVEISSTYFGSGSLEIASSYGDLVYAYVSDGNYSAAVTVEKKSLDILRSVLGNEHEQTISSETFLHDLVSRAVKVRKNGTSIKNSSEKEATTKATKKSLGNKVVDERPLQELLAFIDGVQIA